jgi:hypothetical protein
MSNMTTAEKRWESEYEVTADYLPYRRWYVRADGEAWARVLVSRETGIPLEELTATLGTAPDHAGGVTEMMGGAK